VLASKSRSHRATLPTEEKVDVKIVEIVRDNFIDVVELELEKAQEKYVTSNLFSIAESKLFTPSSNLRAICVSDKVVGFLEYEFGESDADKDGCTIWRFMIDRRRQNSGIGKIALGLLLEEIKAQERCKIVDVYYNPENIVAKRLYANFGFKEVGDRDDGDVIAEITL